MAEINRIDVVKHDLGLETLRVLQKALHQLRPLHAVDVGRPVVDVGRRHQLTALGDAGDQQRAEVGARRIDGCGVAGRPRAQNQDLGVTYRGHGKTFEKIRIWRVQLGPGRGGHKTALGWAQAHGRLPDSPL